MILFIMLVLGEKGWQTTVWMSIKRPGQSQESYRMTQRWMRLDTLITVMQLTTHFLFYLSRMFKNIPNKCHPLLHVCYILVSVQAPTLFFYLYLADVRLGLKS